jgi:hypothetical protein
MASTHGLRRRFNAARRRVNGLVNAIDFRAGVRESGLIENKRPA